MASVDKEERFFTIQFQTKSQIGGPWWQVHGEVKKPVETFGKAYNVFELLRTQGQDDNLRIVSCDAEGKNSSELLLDKMLKIQEEEGWTFAP